MNLNNLIQTEVSREDEISNDELFNLLKDFVTIHTYNNTYSVSVSSSFNNLSKRKQVLVAFLIVEALYRLDMNDSCLISLNEFWELIDEVKPGVHYPHIRNLEKEGSLERKNKKYTIKTKELSNILSDLVW